MFIGVFGPIAAAKFFPLSPVVVSNRKRNDRLRTSHREQYSRNAVCMVSHSPDFGKAQESGSSFLLGLFWALRRDRAEATLHRSEMLPSLRRI